MSAAINLDPLPDVSWKRVAYVEQTNQGTLALAKPCPHLPGSKAGDVLSWNPPGNGHWQWRDPGTAGAYEKENVSGNCVAYKPSDDAFAVFAYLPAVPNV